MNALSMLVLAALVLLPALGWAQSAPPAPDATRPPGVSGQAPAGTSPSAPAPGQPGGTVPDATAPRAQTPGAPGAPGDQAAGDNRIFGLSPLAAVILGLVIVGLIVALMAGRGRRGRDVVTRTDAGLGTDRPAGTYDSEVERERRRRAS